MALSQKNNRLAILSLSILAVFGVTLVIRFALGDIALAPIDPDPKSHDTVSSHLDITDPSVNSPVDPTSDTLVDPALDEEDYDIQPSPVGQFSLTDEDVKDNVDEAVRRKIHYSSYLYSGYQQFIKSYGLKKAAKDASMNDKCSRFFNQLSERNPDWKMKRYVEFNDNIHDMARTMRDVESNLRRQWRDAHGGSEVNYVYNDEEQKKGKIMFEEIVRDSLRTLNEMDETTTIMRVLGKCFFNDDQDRDMQVYHEYTNKIFPFFSGTLPKYYRGDSDVAIENGLPRFDENNQYTGSLIPFDGDSQNLVEYLRTSLNGKGIVISATDKFQKDLIGLIRVLRASGNQLPIQIIHLGDLSAETRNVVLDHATMPMDQLLKPADDKESDQDKLILYAQSLDMTFPTQEIWFVDIRGCVADEFRDNFTKFFEKLLAYTFNSFAEILYLDADAVPLVSTDFLFASKEYQASGTYFFKDRAMKRILRYIDGATFFALSPMNERSIDTLFDIPLLTNKTTGNLYFKGWYHLQEAGVVLIDRRKHFLGTLMTLPLTIWTKVINNMVYGDKELYWLALAMAGDENYEFNANGAAAAGMVFTDPSHDRDPRFNTPTICSTHPAHVNDDGQLLWVNSGLRFCKKNGWEKDKDNDRLKSFTEPELKKLYSEPSIFQGAVVPPDPPVIWSPGWPYESKEWDRVQALIPTYQKDRSKDHLLAPGRKLVALQYGWSSTGVCHNYEYCAFSKVVSFENHKIFDYGKFYLFSEQETELYNFYGKVWMYPYE